MSYAIMRIQKFTAGSCKGIEIHDLRQKEGISHTNKDIDWSRTQENYAFIQPDESSFYLATKKRIEQLQLPRSVRKDAIVMAQALVTSDKDFFKSLSPEEQENFFKNSFDFIKETYGEENIISAIVHMDERTPHMHVNFVPVTPDKKLSAKRLFTPMSLRALQDNYFTEVAKKYELERGEVGSKEKHLDVVSYKIKMQTEKLAELEDELNALEGKALERQEIYAIQPKKAFGGALKEITLEDVQNLKKMAIEYIEIEKKTNDLQRDYERVKRSARLSLDNYTQIGELKRENSDLKACMGYMDKLITSNPDLKELYENVKRKSIGLNKSPDKHRHLTR